MRLEGKVALITGAASGIGRATAILFAKEGAKVAVVDMDELGGQRTASIVGEGGGGARFIKANVTDVADIQNTIKETVQAFGALHILYNNAGIGANQYGATLENVDEEEWDRILGTNLKGVILCSKYAVPEIKRSGGGAIVNTASIAGIVSLPTHAYSAAKAGVIQITKTSAIELSKSNIRVNAVAPGFIDTPLLRGVRSGRGQKEQENVIATYARRTPIGRIGVPEDIAKAVLFLSSDEASFVTGHTLVVDGGYTVP